MNSTTTTTTSNSCNSSSSSSAMTPASPPPGFHGTSFAGRIGQRDVHFLVIRMTDTFFLWVGDDSKTLHELAVAMPPPLPPPQPPSVGPPRPQGSATTLIGVDALSQNIAVKLAKKTGCQVFVSVSLKSVDKETEFELQKRILEELTVNPDAFLTKPPTTMATTTAATMTRMMENTTIT